VCASSHFGTKAESLLINHQQLVTIATMPVHFSLQVFNSWPLSVQTAFMEMKKAEDRTKKMKKFLERLTADKAKKPKKFLVKRRMQSFFKKAEESLKQQEMKEMEAVQAWRSAMVHLVDMEKLEALKNRLGDLIMQDI